MDAELHNATQGRAAAPDIKFAINDETFFRYLDRLKKLNDFLYQEAIPVNPSDSNEPRWPIFNWSSVQTLHAPEGSGGSAKSAPIGDYFTGLASPSRQNPGMT